MSDWITPDEVKEHHDNGYAAGVEHERERIIALLEADKCELEESCTCSATIAYMVATIRGNN